MTFVDAMTKAATAADDAGLVATIEQRVHLQALAQALRELAGIGGDIVMAADLTSLVSSIEKQTEATQSTNELLLEILKRMDEAKEASWQ